MSYIHNTPNHRQGDKCPSCYSIDKGEKGTLRSIKSKFGGFFLGCSRYPACKFRVTSHYTEQPVKKKKNRDSFKKNMPKKFRKEYGEKMNHLRSIT